MQVEILSIVFSFPELREDFKMTDIPPQIREVHCVSIFGLFVFGSGIFLQKSECRYAILIWMVD